MITALRWKMQTLAATVTLAAMYQLLKVVVKVIISRLQLEFTQIRIHSFEDTKLQNENSSLNKSRRFKLDFKAELRNVPLIPFVSIKFTNLQLSPPPSTQEHNSKEERSICSVQIADFIPLNSNHIKVENAICWCLNQNEFDLFAQSILTQPSISFQMQGQVHLYLFSCIPLLISTLFTGNASNNRITGIPMLKQVKCEALDNLQQVQIENLDVVDGLDSVLLLTCSISIYNGSPIAMDLKSAGESSLPPLDSPTSDGKSPIARFFDASEYPNQPYAPKEDEDDVVLAGQLGLIRLELACEGVQVGYCLIPGFHLESRGSTRLEGCRVYLQITPANEEKISSILSRYLASSNGSTEVLLFDISGTEASTSHQLLKYALGKLEMKSPLPRMETTLVSAAYMSLFSLNPLTMTAWSHMDIFNPFSAPIYVYAITKGSVTMSNQLIGTIDYRIPTYSEPIELAPRQITKTLSMPLTLKLSLMAVNALVQVAMNRPQQVHIRCTIECQIGNGFAVKMLYEQDGVKVIFQ